jgi:alpha-D-ribose 1-methylphosphonate 5-phosphate C-P lyase
MLKTKIKVGHCYEFKLDNKHMIVFAVLYGFERGKNKDVYTLMMYTDKGNFEFPIEEFTFNQWVKEGRIKEITPDEALVYAI